MEETRPYEFSQEQFEQMLRAGWFNGRSAELVSGTVFVGNGSGHVEARRWTRDEYLQMDDWCWFCLTKVQLIGGEVIEMPAQHDPHAAGVTLTVDALRAAFGQGYWVRSQATLDLSPHGLPDPDVAVIPGTPRGARPKHIPTSALLLVEVSDSTLQRDRTIMQSLYAAGGITDYWILNLVQRQLEVHRNRVQDASKRFGWWYADRTILDPGDAVMPLALSQVNVLVSDLLP
jgi:Uma2 family endonuclease